MKKFLSIVLALVVAASVLSSCACYEGCPSYGNSNKITKVGYKAQSRYIKHRI